MSIDNIKQKIRHCELEGSFQEGYTLAELLLTIYKVIMACKDTNNFTCLMTFCVSIFGVTYVNRLTHIKIKPLFFNSLKKLLQ
jgi:hypothetical protein